MSCVKASLSGALERDTIGHHPRKELQRKEGTTSACPGVIPEGKWKWSESRSVMSDSLRPHGLHSPWNSPGQNTGVGSLSLLQGIFPIQGSNPGLLYCRQILYQLSHKGSPPEGKRVRKYRWKIKVAGKSECTLPSMEKGANGFHWVLSFSSVQFSHSVLSDSLRPHALKHARLPCLSPTPGVCANSCPLSWWCHPTISVVPFSSSSHPQSFLASGSFQMSQFFALGGQSIGVSASASVCS